MVMFTTVGPNGILYMPASMSVILTISSRKKTIELWAIYGRQSMFEL